jgi:hypothetical protein
MRLRMRDDHQPFANERSNDLPEFVNAVLHAFVPQGERDSPQQIARTTLSDLLASLWAGAPQNPTLGDVRSCVDEAELVGRDTDPDFVFAYDPLLVVVRRFDWSALAE